MDSRTDELLAVSGVSEYVMPNALISSALAMISENRSVNGMLQVNHLHHPTNRPNTTQYNRCTNGILCTRRSC